MAIYHLCAQVIGRSSGRSSVAAAAYRAGERIEDERTGQVHDYTKRKGIEHEIMTPEDAPEWMQNRERLWNAVEAAEKRKDAQVAREFNVALPKELPPEQQRETVRRFVKEEMVDRGMVADVAIHRNDPNNPHAHVMVTMRDVTPEGFGLKNREWNRPELLEEWREKWAEHANRELARTGRTERIDHRSLEAQGIEREPTRHLGPAAAAMERKHIPTERAELAQAAEEYKRQVINFEEAKRELAAARAEQSEGRHPQTDRLHPTPAPDPERLTRRVELTHERALVRLEERQAFWQGRLAHTEKAARRAERTKDALHSPYNKLRYWQERTAELSNHPMDLMVSQKARNQLRYAQRQERESWLGYKVQALARGTWNYEHAARKVDALHAQESYARKALAGIGNEIAQRREALEAIREQRNRTPEDRFIHRVRFERWTSEGAHQVAAIERTSGRPVTYTEALAERTRAGHELQPHINLETSALRTLRGLEADSKRELEGRTAWGRANRAVQDYGAQTEGLRKVPAWVPIVGEKAEAARREYAHLSDTRESAFRSYDRLAKEYGVPAEKLYETIQQRTATAERSLETTRHEAAPIRERWNKWADAEQAFEHQGRERLEHGDATLNLRHMQRLESGRWTPDDSRALREMEARNGGPLSAADWKRLDDLPWNSLSNDTMKARLGTDQAQALEHYQLRRQAGGPANPEMDRTISFNHSRALEELDPLKFDRIEQARPRHRHRTRVRVREDTPNVLGDALSDFGRD